MEIINCKSKDPLKSLCRQLANQLADDEVFQDGGIKFQDVVETGSKNWRKLSSDKSTKIYLRNFLNIINYTVNLERKTDDNERMM